MSNARPLTPTAINPPLLPKNGPPTLNPAQTPQPTPSPPSKQHPPVPHPPPLSNGTPPTLVDALQALLYLRQVCQGQLQVDGVDVIEGVDL